MVATNGFGAWTNNDDLYGPEATPDGRFIAYCAVITNSSGPHSVVHLWDTQSATDTLVSQDMNGNPVTNAMSRAPVVSPDGRFVAFLSNGTNFVANAISNGYHAYIRDTIGSTTQLVDVDTNGAGSIDVNGGTLSISSNGQFVAFGSADGSLVSGDNNHALDAFVRDAVNGTNELVSRRDSTIVPSTGNGITSISQLAVSSDGRWIAFTSQASDLLTNDFNGDSDVFLFDTLGGTNALVSVGLDGNTGTGGYSAWPATSGDGRFIAFQSGATNLVANDTNAASDIFLRDMQSGTTALVSVSMDGLHPGNNDSWSPTISQDGRYVSFLTRATNLAATGTALGAVWHDMQFGTNVIIPGSTTNGLTPAMSADGRFVAYSTSPTVLKVWDSLNSSNIASIASSSSNFSMGLSPAGNRLIYTTMSGISGSTAVFDLILNTNLFVTNTGIQSVGPAQWSSEGRFVVFTSTKSLTPSDNNGTNDVFLLDVDNRTMRLVSMNLNDTASGNGSSDQPALSSDGRYVVYRTFATDIVPGIVNVPNIVMYDRRAGSNILLSAGQPASSWSWWMAKPAANTNGSTIAFQSWAPELVGQDLNNVEDAFTFEQQPSVIVQTNPPPVFEAQIAPTGGTNMNQLVMTWPAIVGPSYQVQFTTNLSDPQWLLPAGSVWIVGGQAYFNVPVTQSSAFYRVVLIP